MSAAVPYANSGPHHETRYSFVDAVRFWSMFALVAMHSTGFIGLGRPWLTEVLITPSKFGTIGFFVISGFLLGGRIDKVSPAAYIRKRFDKVFVPWAFWVCLFSCFTLAIRLVHPQNDGVLDLEGPHPVAAMFHLAVLRSPYWFVPNLLIAMGVLLLFRRYLDDVRFGAALLAITLFYSANIYCGWVPVLHTEALFGFVFFLWLGNYAALNRHKAMAWIAEISAWKLMAGVVLAGLVSLAETRILVGRGVADPLNTLRVSNLLYSILAVLLLVKVGTRKLPRFIDVPKQTFGIYLMHPIVLALVVSAMKRALKFAHLHPSSSAGLIAEWVIVTFLSYGLSLMAAKAIAAVPSMRWSIGLESSAPPSRIVATPRHLPIRSAVSYRFESRRATSEQFDVATDGLWAARLAGG